MASATHDNTYPYALSVLGAGSYGTALALAVASKGVPVLLYARSPAKAQQMAEQREMRSIYRKSNSLQP